MSSCQVPEPILLDYSTGSKYNIGIMNRFQDKNLFTEIVTNSKSIKECLGKLGLKPNAGNYKTFHKYCTKYDVKAPMYDKKENATNITTKKLSLSSILIEHSTYNTSHLKSRLLKENLLENQCAVCSMEPEWNGKELRLQLDHINGVNNDNRLPNLRLLCPNCHSQTDTYCGVNRRKNKITVKPIVVYSPKGKRKVERPPYKQLKEEVVSTGYTAVGKKYGVSDNSIRKWIKWYEKELNNKMVD